MSLVPGMISDGSVPGTRSVPQGRRPCQLICAPLRLDIARGVVDRRGVPTPGGGVQIEIRSRSGFKMPPLYTSARMLEDAAETPLSATFRHVFDRCLGWIRLLQVQWASSNGNNARRSPAMAKASGACHHELPGPIDGVVQYGFSSLLKTQGECIGHPRASALGFVVLAFQAEEFVCGISIQMGEGGNRQAKA